MNLQKLSIRGIRSFGPSDSDVQSITFFSPVTLIVGPNGTGKTTVIECLRYSSTGEMPAGSRQGGCFVHDLKLAETNEVRAQVRLSFDDVSGKLINVQRSLSASIPLKAKQVSLRTLENAISRTDQDGNVAQISSKCVDVDREIVECLGVSKAVLENVIFCHQEDCNWPLSEGKVVKAKFDDIFATTKYARALEEIRKIRMEKHQKFKLSSMESMHLRRNRDRADEINRQIRDCELKLAKATNELAEINAQIPSQKSVLDSATQRIQRFHQSHEQIQGLRSEKALLETQIKELSQLIEKSSYANFTETDTRDLLREHEAKILEYTKLVKQYESSISDLHNSRAKCASKVDDIFGKLQNLGCQSSTMQVLESSLASNKAKLADLLAKVGGAEFERIFKAKEDAAKKDVRCRELEYDEFNGRKCSEQHKITALKQRNELLESQLKAVDESLAALKTSASLIAEIDQKLSAMENELADTNASSTDEMKCVLAEKLSKRTELEVLLSDCDGQMQSAVKTQQIRCEIDICQRTLNQKSNQLESVLDGRSKDFAKLLGIVPRADELAKAVAEKINSKSDELSRLTQIEQSQSNSVATLKSRLEMQKEQFDQKTNLFKTMSEQLMEAGLPEIENLQQTYDSMYESKSDELRSKQDDKGFSLGVEKTYSKFIEKLESTDSCPLCHREFGDYQEKEDLVEEMKQTISAVPLTKTRLDKEIELLSDEFSKIVSLKPTVDQFAECRKSVEKADDDVKTTLAEVNKTNQALNQSRLAVKSIKKELNALNALQADANTIDSLSKEVGNLSSNLKKQQRRSEGDSCKKTVKQIQDERCGIQAELSDLSRRIENQRSDISAIEHRRLELAGEIEREKNRRFVILSDSSNAKALSEKRSEFRGEIERVKSEIGDSERSLAELEAKCESLMKVRNTAASLAQSICVENSRLTHDINYLRLWIFESEEKLTAYREKTLPAISATEAELSKSRESLERIDCEIRGVQALLETKRNEAISIEREKRIIADIESLQARQKRYRLIEKEISSFLGCDLDLNSLLEDERRARSDHSRLLSENQRLTMTIETQRTSIQQAKKQLTDPSLIKARENFVDCAANLRACELTCADLDKLYFALDRSIMSFHTSKMQELNKIIRRLWQTTYRGLDIDYIEIRSEIENQPSGFVRRRNYNYKVVMVCSGTAIEMRYRCSAGQKVLASLLIRLALAEAFGTECGIIALDEPTTNLDRENIESLACSLIGLIQTRRAQKNFQLIIITHDEDFVEILGRSQCVDHFYRIYKNSRNMSMIKKCDVKELN